MAIQNSKNGSSSSNKTEIKTREKASAPSSSTVDNSDNNTEKATQSDNSENEDNAQKASSPSPLLFPALETDAEPSGSSETPPSSPPLQEQSPPPSSPPHSPPQSPPPSQSSPPPSSPPPSSTESPPPPPSSPTPTPTPPAPSLDRSPPQAQKADPPPQQSNTPSSPSPSSPSPSSPSPSSPSPSPSPPVQTQPSPSSQVSSPSIPTPASPNTQFIPPPPVTTRSTPNTPLPPQSESQSQSRPVSNSTPNSTPPSSSLNSQTPSTPAGSSNRTGEYVSIALGVVVVVGIVAAVALFVLRRRKQRGSVYVIPPFKKGGGDVHYYVENPGYVNGPQEHISNGQIVFFTYDKIAEITNNFSTENVIGEGGFGYVYKALMPDGRVGAVKMLKAGSGQGEREFRAEVDIISRIHHRHLVSLIGYCISEQQRVLIYEYVPNGNLNRHLHGNTPVLDWSKRMKIAIGAARGLAYLHEGCSPKIIHRDIKSANILLDDAYEAQVADFGLARLTDDANTHVSTRVMGTFGYMAPEYATSGKLTDRSDVFSFGVVLLELITGRKPVDPTQPIGDESLVEWARPLLLSAIETGEFVELVDPRLERHYVDSEMFRMIEAAAACIRHSAPKRPSMVQVTRALDSGDQLYDLSNGVKFGQSTIYDSSQYNEDITRFRMIGNESFGDSEFGMYSSEYPSREMMSAHNHASSGGDSEVKPFNPQMNSGIH